MKTKLLLLASVVLVFTGTGFALTADPNITNGTFEDPVLVGTSSSTDVVDWWEGGGFNQWSGVGTRKWGSANFKGGTREGLNGAQMVTTRDCLFQPVALFQPNTPYQVSCIIQKRDDQVGPSGRIELWAGGTPLGADDPVATNTYYGSAGFPLTVAGATLVDSVSFDYSNVGKWNFLWGTKSFTLATDSSHTTSDPLYLVFVKTGGGQLAVDAVTMTISDQTILTSPEDGAVDVAVDASLEWVGPGNYENEVFDVYIGTSEPNFSEGAPYGMTLVADGTPENSASPALDYETTYYWAVDVYEPNATEPGNYLYHPATTFSSFTTLDEDVDPVVEFDQDGFRTWLDGPTVTITATVTDREAIADINWEFTTVPAEYAGDPSLFLTDNTTDMTMPTADIVVPNDPTATGYYEITLTATDDAGGAGALTGSKIIWFTVHNTPCDARKANGGGILPEDINSDCKVDLLDLAELSQAWLDDRNPANPIIYLP